MTQSSKSPGSYLAYSTGFGLSILLTLLAYLAVTQGWGSHQATLVFIMLLAILQFIVQAVFFLHLGQESKPRWNLMLFLFMLMVLFILVAGSLWIMYHLDYHTMSPHATEQILQEENISR